MLIYGTITRQAAESRRVENLDTFPLLPSPA
jgi:hypothetical protein